MNTKSSLRSISALIVLAALVLACGSQTPPSTSTPSPTNTSIPPQPTAAHNTVAKPKLTAESLQGTYNISGTNLEGNQYNGTLSLALNDSYALNGAKIDVYDATWGDGSIGTGILIANMLATSFGSENCGAVFYAIDSDMSLAGLWLSTETKQIGSENAIPTQTRQTLAGDYQVSGTNPDDTTYEGLLTLIEQGDVWQMIWDIGESVTDGVGISVDDLFAAAYGGEGCGVGLYTATSDNNLAGVWAQWGSQQIGTETAIKQ